MPCPGCPAALAPAPPTRVKLGGSKPIRVLGPGRPIDPSFPAASGAGPPGWFWANVHPELGGPAPPGSRGSRGAHGPHLCLRVSTPAAAGSGLRSWPLGPSGSHGYWLCQARLQASPTGPRAPACSPPPTRALCFCPGAALFQGWHVGKVTSPFRSGPPTSRSRLCSQTPQGRAQEAAAQQACRGVRGHRRWRAGPRLCTPRSAGPASFQR